MPSEKFRITTNGQSLRNPNNGFFDITLSANMTLDTSDVSANNDRRSAHNALERQRREHLNNKFQQLALALPSLQSVRRPSKTMIVAKSLEFVSSSLQRESKFISEIQKLRKENEKLRKQAGLSSSNLKNKKDAKKSEKDEKDEKKEEKETSLKRKASSESQLSPPPTPETRRIENKRSHIAETDDEEEEDEEDSDEDDSDEDDDEEEEEEEEDYRPAPPQKKRMLQQHKSPKLEPVPEPTLSTVSTVSTITAPVASTIQEQHQHSEQVIASAPTHVVDSQQWSTFDPSLCQSIDDLIPLTNNVYTDAYASSNNDLLFMPSNCGASTDVYDNCDPLAMQTPVPESYNDMVNPTLFTPYYFQQEPNALNYNFDQKNPNFFMS
ncbi:hypothetical protein K501DRAFT_233464 [Backusella circina FSU 941]|nr:hypothetical protein K501DRAFT_233464 [Backusella circina FSU 941]